jgi:glycosyltransferase involved in cell wall biosynthesis
VRVLLVNAFHYPRGGVERTYLDASRWLAARGHDVAHFAIRDPRNLASPTARHFAPAVDYGEGAPLAAQVVGLPAALWSRAAARAMGGLLATFRPDVAHLHAPSRYLTPSVLRPLEAAGVPMVMTLHDFKPWCTNRVLFARGAPCERCRGGAHWHAAVVGCVQGSRLKSAVGAVEAYLHDALDAYRAVRLWIAPSAFVLGKARGFGVAEARLRLLRHGIETTPVGTGDAARDASPPSPPEGPYVLFAGRLSVEKGVALLPGIAAAIGGTPLLVAGAGPLAGELERAAGTQPNLRLLGHLSREALAALRARAAVVVVPSLSQETFCYAAAEAQLDGRVVVAANAGAIPELVEHEVTGLLAPRGDGAALGAAVARALHDPAAAGWAGAGRERVAQLADPSRHVEGLIRIYEEARAG